VRFMLDQERHISLNDILRSQLISAIDSVSHFEDLGVFESGKIHSNLSFDVSSGFDGILIKKCLKVSAQEIVPGSFDLADDSYKILQILEARKVPESLVLFEIKRGNHVYYVNELDFYYVIENKMF